MDIFPDSDHMRAQDVDFDSNSLIVRLLDGRTVTVPLTWFPRILHATDKERANFVIMGNGQGIHWPDIDEDVSVSGLVLGIPSIESDKPAKAG